MEHIGNTALFAVEVHRVLKPGGWFCARTPTKYNYVSLGARLVANSRHAVALRILQPDRRAEDVFPTRYYLNTRSDIRRASGLERFEDHTHLYSSEPQYPGRQWVYRALRLTHRVLPSLLAGNLFVFLRKLPAPM